MSELRERLLAAGYTVDAVLDLLGPSAYSALGRGETVPALRATTGGSPLETLTRLFVLQAPVAGEAAAATLGAAAHDRLRRLGALVGGGPDDAAGSVRATLDIRPYASDDTDYYVVSDLGTGIGGVTGPVRPDHVLGVGGASTTLAQITVRPPVRRALDLGTGCGVQALHLTAHCDQVVGTDRNPRALAYARMSAELSGVTLDLREGSLYEPVAGERFDLVVTNPPFVMSPVPTYAYRDSELDGDDLGRRLVREAPDHLAEGGWFQALVCWLHVSGQDWRERVAEWVVPTGCDAWVVQREVLDPAQYVELWLRDSGDAGTAGYPDRYDGWLGWLAAQRAEGVGFGWVTLRATGAADPSVRLEDVPGQVEQPVGPHVLERFVAVDRLRGLDDDALLALPLRAAPGVHLRHDVELSPGARPGPAELRQRHGLRRAGPLDPVGAEVVRGCDGSRPLAEVLAAVAAAHGLPAADLREGSAAAVRTLVEEGFLTLPAAGA